MSISSLSKSKIHAAKPLGLGVSRNGPSFWEKKNIFTAPALGRPALGAGASICSNCSSRGRQRDWRSTILRRLRQELKAKPSWAWENAPKCCERCLVVPFIHIYIYIHTYIYISIYLFIYLFTYLSIYLFIYLLHTWFFKVIFSTTNSRSLNPKKSQKEPPQKGHFEEPGSSVNSIYCLFTYIYIYIPHKA